MADSLSNPRPYNLAPIIRQTIIQIIKEITITYNVEIIMYFINLQLLRLLFTIIIIIITTTTTTTTTIIIIIIMDSIELVQLSNKISLNQPQNIFLVLQAVITLLPLTVQLRKNILLLIIVKLKLDNIMKNLTNLLRVRLNFTIVQNRQRKPRNITIMMVPMENITLKVVQEIMI